MDDIIKCTVLLLVAAILSSQSVLKFATGAAEGEDVIYIKPSPGAVCPAEPCYTLSQFATNQSLSQLQFNTTLLLLPGNHSLDLAIFITDIDYFSIQTYHSSSPLDVVIQCEHNASISLSNITNVTIHGLTFYGCGDNRISSVNELKVKKCSFIGSEESGTALNLFQSNAVITNCSFLSNVVGTYHGPLIILEKQWDPSYANFTAYAYVGGAMIANQSDITFVQSKFEKNHAGLGGAVFSTLGSQVSVIDSTFTENSVCLLPLYHYKYYSVCFGGAFFCENENSQVEIINSEFRNNNGFNGGVFTIFDRCTIHISSSNFSENTAMHYPGYGGVLYLQDQATAFIDRSRFFNNSATSAAGAVNVDNSLLIIRNSEFTSHSVEQFGGVIVVISGNLTIDRSCFGDNYAFSGGVINALSQCSITIYDSQFSNNEAKSNKDPIDAFGGAITIAQSCILSVIRTLFHGNLASYGGAIGLASRSELYVVNSSFVANRALLGGAIGAQQSEINFFGSCNNITNNAAGSNGGAIFATDNSFLNVSGELSVILNNANDSGGGIYLFRSKLYCQFNSILKLLGNEATGKGGGIFAINTIVNIFSDRDSSVESALIFEGNTAAMGGGIYLELATEMHVIKSGNDYTKTIINLRFIDNSADYGGAIYNADETNYKICASKSYYNRKDSIGTECFLQILTPMQTLDMKYNITTTEFVNNSARISGPVLYGGLLDRCTLMPGTEILLTKFNNGTSLTFFLRTSTLSDADDISSSPVQVCLCEPGDDGKVPNCNLQQLNISVMRGEKFHVSLVAVNQVNRILPNITVYSSLKYAESGLGEGQMAQVTAEECTTFSFSVLSPQPDEEITLYADGPCRNATKSQRNVLISFLDCSCPIGFQPNKLENNSCVCDCDPKLRQYVSNCSSQTDSIVREGNYWISYLGSTGPNEYNYLTYPHCPLDYCLPPDIKVGINLTEINGTDSQCAYSRSGVLCGVCQPGFTLSLGGSRCIPCSDEWPPNLADTLIVAPVLGIALIAIMLILKLTVDKGTLNGLTFYANVIGANSTIFFPSSLKTLRVFISWLNLDIGFDICFFKGMDTYWKTWIQLAFPAYVILLVIAVMLWSERSRRFSRLILRKNPVATLATLILLSYANFLRTVITSLSFVTLSYPGGDRIKWLPDATVAYLQGRHIVLFVAAILILLIGIVYTFLLFAWQWLRAINSVTESYHLQKLSHFMEVYHAPYKYEHRYWTGLLLLARVGLYLVFVFSNPSLNLLVIIAVACGLLFLKGHFGTIYKSRMVDTIEMINYLNIALFSAATFFAIQTRKYQTEIAITSVSVTLVLFLFILAYHIHTELLSVCWRALILKISKMYKRRSFPGSDISRPTYSTIDGLPEEEPMPSILDEPSEADSENHASQVTDKDDDTQSTDSSTPLLQDQTHN